MSSQKETLSSGNDANLSNEEEIPVAAEVNQPDLQAEGDASLAELSPSSSQPGCSSSASGQVPAQGLGEAPAQGLGETPAQEIGMTPANVLGQAPVQAPVHLLGEEHAELIRQEYARLLRQAPAQLFGQVPMQTLGQAPQQVHGLSFALGCKLLQDMGDFNYALNRQMDALISNSKSGKEERKNGTVREHVPFVPVNRELVNAQAGRRMDGTWHAEMEAERKAAMEALESEETTDSGNNQVGGNACTHQCSLHCPSRSNANQDGGEGN